MLQIFNKQRKLSLSLLSLNMRSFAKPLILRNQYSPFEHIEKDKRATGFHERVDSKHYPVKKILAKKKEIFKRGSLFQEVGPIGNIMIILNYKIPKFLPALFHDSHLVICADGGANRLYDAVPEHNRVHYTPDVILGDLDSIRPEVRYFYENQGSTIQHFKDQSTNDLLKCMRWVDNWLKSTYGCALVLGEIEKEMKRKLAVNKDDYVKTNFFNLSKGIDYGMCSFNMFVMGAMGGRIDHEFANFHAALCFQQHRIFLFSDGNYTRWLHPGRHLIHINKQTEGPVCGLIPLASVCRSCSTKGLKWNVENECLEFGKLISTSNEVADNHVFIENSDPLIWTIQLKKFWEKEHPIKK
ncbi:thiamine pyrophosphokinase 1 [Anaeramoeba flamelloides]|uniref:Thiamine pyrophosphokinase 1 n=1 Tax=Anaeramoeba flamelloides TaxID=1746091 RepID=A0ABQ8X084_9EUKA|nr:thiamine pyrophosphokinase 1 [Anaeramoeba flamelloides]